MTSSHKLCLASLVICLSVVMGGNAFADDKNVGGPLNEELDNYWSVERELPVVQGRMFTREGRFGIGLYVGLMSSEPYWWYLPVGGRLSYSFTDQWAIEIDGQFTGADGVLTHGTDLQEFLEGQVGGFDSSTDLEDRFVWRANAMAVWSPIYGKWSFANKKLNHFDVNIAAGAGVVSLERPSVDRSEATTEIKPELVTGVGMSFLFSDNWQVRADGRFYFYQAAETESNTEDGLRLAIPIEFLLGVHYLF